MVIDFFKLFDFNLFDFNLFDFNLFDYFYSKTFIISILFIIIICIIGCIITAFIFCMICSYFIYKYLRININDNYVYFYDYNYKIKALLEKYGDHAINKMYLIREPISNIIYNFIKVITFYRCNYSFPYHTALMCEINMPNNIKKYIFLEKNNCININENYNINEKQNIKRINLCIKKSNQGQGQETEEASNNMKNKNPITLNHILEQTRERIGDEKFFNWHIYKNNCQLFTKEILITLNKFNKRNKEYIFQDKLLKNMFFPEITIHIFNCFINSYNIIQKYLF
jgi:hypothetical protein